MKQKLILCILVAVVIFLTGCSAGGLRETETGALGGATLGAGLGAIVGHETGKTGAGIAIGTAAGLLAGGLIGHQAERTTDRINEQDQKLSAQERQLEENRKLLEQLRRQGADVRSTDRGVVVNLPDVLFDFNSARLGSAARRTIGDIAKVVKDIPDRKISVEGHTDAVGTVRYNQQLSVARARSVADSLVDNNVSSNRIRVRGYGEGDPIATNSTDIGRARNRRVEVIIENR